GILVSSWSGPDVCADASIVAHRARKHPRRVALPTRAMQRRSVRVHRVGFDEIRERVLSMRKLLDASSIAQSLDGNRLTGSLRIPKEPTTPSRPWHRSAGRER